MKITSFIFTIFFLFNNYASGDQLIPNGNYEFIWTYTDGNRTEKIRTDYAKIIDTKVNFTSMPCSRGLEASQVMGFKYKISNDLSQLHISGTISIWDDQWLYDPDAKKKIKAKFKYKFDEKTIISNDSKFYELKDKIKYHGDENISLTIARATKEPSDNFKCLFERIDFMSASPKSAHEMMEGLDKIKEKKTKVFGKLLLPENLDQKVPVMIMSHPSMGFVPDDWFRWFYDLGIGVFDVQHYLSRGGNAQWFYDLASEEAGTVDLYRALDVIAEDPRVDKNQIYVMGWSYGGMTVTNAHQKFFIDRIKPKNEFQAFISYYPYCPLVKENVETSSKPLIILSAEKDRMCPIELCEDYINIVKNSSPQSNMYVFPNSYHRFDFPRLPKYLNIGRAESWSEEYLQKKIQGKRYDIGVPHKEITGPNGFSYFSLMDEKERDEILEPDRQDANYIGYNKKADLAAREIIKELLSNL